MIFPPFAIGGKQNTGFELGRAQLREMSLYFVTLDDVENCLAADWALLTRLEKLLAAIKAHRDMPTPTAQQKNWPVSLPKRSDQTNRSANA